MNPVSRYEDAKGLAKTDELPLLALGKRLGWY